MDPSLFLSRPAALFRTFGVGTPNVSGLIITTGPSRGPLEKLRTIMRHLFAIYLTPEYFRLKRRGSVAKNLAISMAHRLRNRLSDNIRLLRGNAGLAGPDAQLNRESNQIAKKGEWPWLI
jgi:hypothetical protein